MLKIEQWVKEHHGITLTPQQLEIIAIIASGKDMVIQRPARQAGFTTAYKAAIAYLQDGLTEVREQELLTELDAIVPDWQHAKLTKIGFHDQRLQTLLKLKAFILDRIGGKK